LILKIEQDILNESAWPGKSVKKRVKILRAICVLLFVVFVYFSFAQFIVHTDFSPRFVITTDDMTDSPDTRRPIKPPDPVLPPRRICQVRFNLCHKTDGSASFLDILRHILSNYTLSQETRQLI